MDSRRRRGRLPCLDSRVTWRPGVAALSKSRQPFVQALRALGLDQTQAPIHRLQKRWRVGRRVGLRQTRQGICPRAQQLALAPRRLDWRLACDGAVAQRRKRIDVRPRALGALALVLLRRRVAGGRDGRHAPGIAPPQRLPRRAEVQQHRRLVRAAHEDVGGLDVAVQEAGRVHLAQPVRHRQHHPLQLRFRERAVALEQRVQRLAILVVHHDVGGVVGLEAVPHPHHVGMLEPRQRPRLVQKPAQAPLEALAVAGRLRVYLRAVAHRDLVRQVLLHRHLHAQPAVLAQIGDAKSASPKHPHHPVAAKAVAGRQRLLVVFNAHGGSLARPANSYSASICCFVFQWPDETRS